MTKKQFYPSSIKLQVLEINLRNLYREVKTTAFKLDALKASYQRQKLDFEALQRIEFEAAKQALKSQTETTDKAGLKELKKILGTDANVRVFLADLLGKHSDKTQPTQVKIYQNPYFTNTSKETA